MGGTVTNACRRRCRRHRRCRRRRRLRRRRLRRLPLLTRLTRLTRSLLLIPLLGRWEVLRVDRAATFARRSLFLRH